VASASETATRIALAVVLVATAAYVARSRWSRARRGRR